MKARPLQSTLFLPHHLLLVRLGKQNPFKNPSTTLNAGKSLQISETPTWVLDYALPPWKNPSLLCKHILWWSSSAILMMSQPWKTKLTPLPHKSPHLKNNYFSTKPPRQHNAPPPHPPPPPTPPRHTPPHPPPPPPPPPHPPNKQKTTPPPPPTPHPSLTKTNTH